ncbi:H(+)-transporting V1 sector ATPase subunit F, variant 2 [Taiwanofungus camphoratus]|nr:H(+)-transporting V1 sector ATPase subunit F, variant 2 [Antrodia cinnamomea]KAI0961202.1 H(+)-transporting V1 sector ATPase subunit F, variant 2 [Antrodia cinnamomea]
MASTSFKERNLLAVIGDEDSVTGLLLAGIGHIGQNHKRNFLIVDSKTQVANIEAAFEEFTERKDIAILLINQHVCLIYLDVSLRLLTCYMMRRSPKKFDRW